MAEPHLAALQKNNLGHRGSNAPKKSRPRPKKSTQSFLKTWSGGGGEESDSFTNHESRITNDVWSSEGRNKSRISIFSLCRWNHSFFQLQLKPLHVSYFSLETSSVTSVPLLWYWNLFCPFLFHWNLYFVSTFLIFSLHFLFTHTFSFLFFCKLFSLLSFLLKSLPLSCPMKISTFPSLFLMNLLTRWLTSLLSRVFHANFLFLLFPFPSKPPRSFLINSTCCCFLIDILTFCSIAWHL